MQSTLFLFCSFEYYCNTGHESYLLEICLSSDKLILPGIPGFPGIPRSPL